MTWPAESFQSYTQFGYQLLTGTAAVASYRPPIRDFTHGDDSGRYTSPVRGGDRDPGRASRPTGANVPITIAQDVSIKSTPFFANSMWQTATPTTIETVGRQYLYTTAMTGTGYKLTAEDYDGGDGYLVRDIVLASYSMSASEANEGSASWGGFGTLKDDLTTMATVTETTDDALMAWEKEIFIGTAGTIPTTELTRGLIDFNFGFTATATPKFNQNRSRYAGMIARGSWNWNLSFTVIPEATRYLWSQYEAGTQVNVRVGLTTSVITGGAIRKGVWGIFCGTLQGRAPIDSDGARAYTFTLAPKRDATLGYSGALQVINEVTSYPAAS